MNISIKLLYISIILLVGCQSFNPPKIELSSNDIKVEKMTDSKVTTLAHEGFTIPVLPATLTFAGEDIPLDNKYVRQRLQRELIIHAYRHGRMLITLSEKSMWESHIKQVLQENEVSEDFFYLAIAESELEPEIVSHSGAVGVWQIMKETGKEYGMVIDNYVDERRDPIKATEFACQYLKKAKSKFGKWTLAAISYNRGMNGLARAIENQQVSEFNELYLNNESSRYLFRILALKIIFSEPEKYGFHLEENQKKYNADFVKKELKKGEYNVVELAKKYSMTYRELKELNPWLIDAKKYELKVKKQSVDLLVFALK